MSDFSGSATCIPWKDDVKSGITLNQYQAHLLPIMEAMGKYYETVNDILKSKTKEGEESSLGERLAIQPDGEVTTYYLDGIPIFSGAHIFVGDTAYCWEIKVY